jgi:hypothetical protein
MGCPYEAVELGGTMNLVPYWTVLSAEDKTRILKTYNDALPIGSTPRYSEILRHKPGLKEITMGMLPFMERAFILKMLEMWYQVGARWETALDEELHEIIRKLDGEITDPKLTIDEYRKLGEKHGEAQ